MGKKKYSLSADERLKGKKKIEELFKTGFSFYLNSFQVRYKWAGEEGTHRILASVPKRNFKRAVDRNLIKRRAKEAYRLNKHLIYSDTRKGVFYIAFIYLSKNILTFHEMECQLIACLKRLDTVVE